MSDAVRKPNESPESHSPKKPEIVNMAEYINKQRHIENIAEKITATKQEEAKAMQSIRIIEIPKCKMVSSGTGLFGEDKLDKFNSWFSGLPRSIFPKDFLYWDGKGLCWLYLYDESLNVPEEFEIINFEGGLYAIATDIDQKTDIKAMKKEVDKFLDESGLVRDESRFDLGNIITSPMVKDVLGYNQMDYYAPIKAKQ